ncbi:DUF3093 domain-containing protein [Mycolicibacterium sediminis]|uniref:DUF3093 domain-containing protein n=1 Tax=Mycolicibacterium sediminis TaxID=1286180 RepID=UPI0013D08249|nr:DUF3093 domain-containing protein [Mycolicibacterium sediminis]
MTAPEPTPAAPPAEVLYSEPGATWWWAMAGPGAAGAMILLQWWTGYGVDFLVPIVFFVLVTGFLSIQVKAARTHTSVELTPEYLRQGTETIRTSEIITVYPEAEGSEAPKWQSARALGELTGVPRGRTGIGLKLTSGRTAQAWARRHRRLRAALESLNGES